MSLDENISNLIGRIYESVYDPEQWERVLLETRTLLNASFILETIADLRHRDLSRSRFYGGGSSRFDDGAKAYEHELYLSDPSFHWAASHPSARFCDTAEIMPLDEWNANEFVRETKSLMGSAHWLVGYTAPEDELTFGLSIHPPSESGPVGKWEKALFKLLFEHMDRAIRLMARAPSFVAEEEMLILLDRHGFVREVSSAAEAVVKKSDGLHIFGGKLQGSAKDATAQLNAAVASALDAQVHGSFGGAVSLPRPSGRRNLLVTVSPLPTPPPPFEAFRPAALVRIVDPEQGVEHSTVHRWAFMFGLTPAEMRLCEALVNCEQNLHRAADELGIAYATARVHLRHLFEKTDTHSQAQLARLLTRVE